MKKTKLLAALVCSAGLVFGSAASAMADSVKVVSLGNDLTQEQKNTMLKYFNVSQNQAKIILVTNQDERNHLLGYVPESQIGTRTLSCAYVKPTESGGIKVRTANLNWVTCNMIASSLSTAGVKNCEVVAACPFEVSGTGALTGVQMAYESATGTTLDANKKKLAAQEVVVTERYATDVGKKAATTVINKSKIEIIQNNVTNINEIYNTVVNIAQQNNYNITTEQAEEITEFLEKVAEQDYEYEDVKDTLESVDENLTGEVSEDEDLESEVLISDEDTILDEVDPSVFEGEVIEESTEDVSLAEETGYSDEVEMSDEDMNFEFDEDLAEETIENGLSDEVEEYFTVDDFTVDDFTVDDSIDDLADGGLSDEISTDGEDYINIEPDAEQIFVDPEIDAEGSEINAEDPSAQIPDSMPESEYSEYDTTQTFDDSNTDTTISADTLNVDLLSEQAKSQYTKAEAFCKGEFEGDYNQLNTAVGEDAYNYNYATVLLDQTVAQTISKAIQASYYNILMGTTPYYADGTEQYMSDELNAMNQYLKQFFGLQYGTPDASIATLTEADRTTLYNDTIRFFANLYGELTVDTYVDDGTGEYAYSENTDDLGEISGLGEGYDYSDYSLDYDEYEYY